MRNPWKTLISKAKTAARPGQEKKNGIKRTLIFSTIVEADMWNLI